MSDACPSIVDEDVELAKLIDHYRYASEIIGRAKTISCVKDIIMALGTRSSVVLDRLITADEGAKLSRHGIFWKNQTAMMSNGYSIVSWNKISE